MIFSDSVCFEISVSGVKSKVEKFVRFLTSGEFDDFFEINDELFIFDDDYETAAIDAEVEISFSSDEFGIEVDEFDSDDFLEIFCKAGKELSLRGNFYNFDDDEIRFFSEEGDDYYINGNNFGIFNDELDMQASREDAEEE